MWINLIDNAVKFSPEHETIDITIRAVGERLTFLFTNKGDPIPAAALSHIFDKFYQTDTSHATQGNGLGLAIVQKIIKLHEGTVTASCSGTDRITFEVIL